MKIVNVSMPAMFTFQNKHRLKFRVTLASAITSNGMNLIHYVSKKKLPTKELSM